MTEKPVATEPTREQMEWAKSVAWSLPRTDHGAGEVMIVARSLAEREAGRGYEELVRQQLKAGNEEARAEIQARGVKLHPRLTPNADKMREVREQMDVLIADFPHYTGCVNGITQATLKSWREALSATPLPQVPGGAGDDDARSLQWLARDESGKFSEGDKELFRRVATRLISPFLARKP